MRAERQPAAVALAGRLVERRGDQLRTAQRRQRGDGVGERHVERLGAVAERVHRAGAQAAVVQRGHLERVGDHQLRPHADAAHSTSRPAGRRWIVRHLGARRAWSASRRRVRRARAAIAFAVSITRPPPSATSVGFRTAVDDCRRGGIGHRPRARPDARRSSARRDPAGAAPRARVVVRSSNRSQTVPTRISVESASAPGRKTIVRSPSCQVKSRSAIPRARGGIRTRSLCLTRALLHQLSYPGSS